MTNHKKYPHVPCRSIRLRLDRVLEMLECHRRVMLGKECVHVNGREAKEVMEELRKVIEYRGNLLWVRKGRSGRIGEHMTISRENGS